VDVDVDVDVDHARDDWCFAEHLVIEQFPFYQAGCAGLEAL